jgi:hypothetical protein
MFGRGRRGGASVSTFGIRALNLLLLIDASIGARYWQAIAGI